MSKWIGLIAVGIIAGCVQGAPRASAAEYKVIEKIALPGDGGWDYVTADGDGQRVYIARATRVMVVDLKKKSLVGEVPDTQGVHGVALVPGSKVAYASNGRDNSVTVFDKATLKETARIKVGENPDAIAYNAATKRIFTMNGRSNDATAIDAATGKVAGTVPFGGKPEAVVSDGKTMYVNIEDKSEIVKFDAQSLKVLAHWSLAPGEGPTGLSIDPKTHRLFSACDGKLIVVDTKTGKVTASPTIGGGADGDAFDPATGLIFTTNGGDATVSVLKEAADGSVKVVQTVPTQAGARTVSLDPKTHRVYTITADFEAPAPGATSRRRTMKPGTFVLLVLGEKE